MNVTGANNFLNLTQESRDDAIDMVMNKRDIVVQTQSDLSDHRDTAQRMMEIHKNQIWSEEDLAFFESFDASPIQFSVARPLVNKLIYRERNSKFKYQFSPMDPHSFRRYKSEREQYIQDNLQKHDYSSDKAGEFYDQYADDKYGKAITQMNSKYRQLCKAKYKESECFEGGVITAVDFLKAERNVDGWPEINRRSFQKMGWDTNSTEYDLSDAEYIYEIEEYYKQDLVAEFPEHKDQIEKHFERYTQLNNNNRLSVDKKWKDWFDLDDTQGPKVKVCNFWYEDTEKRYYIYDKETGDEREVEYGYDLDQIYDELMIKTFDDLMKSSSDKDRQEIMEDPDIKKKVYGLVEKRYDVEETYRKIFKQCVFTFNSLLVHKRSHYPHGGHPYRPFFAQFNDGNFTSFLEDIEEIIIALNKAIAFREMLLAHSSKGMVIVDEQVLEDSNYTKEEIAEQYSSVGGLVALKLKINKGIGDAFQQISTVGDGIPAINNVIADYDKRLYNISGVNLAQLGFTQGETPTSRYKMQLNQGQENNGLIFDNFVRTKESFYQDIFIPLVAERMKANPKEVKRMVGKQSADFHDLDFDDEFDLVVDAIYKGEYVFKMTPIDANGSAGQERNAKYWEIAMNGGMPIEIPIKYSDDPNRFEILRDLKEWKHQQKLQQLEESIDLKRIQQILLNDKSVTAEQADMMLKKMKAVASENAEKQKPKPKNMEKIKQNASKTKQQANIDKSTNPKL